MSASWADAADSDREVNPFGGDANQENTSIDFDDYEDTPIETSGEDVPPPVHAFADIDLGEALNLNIRRCKYVTPTPIQRHVETLTLIHAWMQFHQLIFSSLTFSFLIILLYDMLRSFMHTFALIKKNFYHTCLSSSLLFYFMLMIHDKAKKFSYQTGVKVVVAYGGTPIDQQLMELEKGVDILVATPGRLNELLERATVTMQMIKFLALDEADRMMDMGFEPQIRKIVEQMDMPPRGRLASDFLSNYIFLAVGMVGSSPDLITLKVEYVHDSDKRSHLMALLHAQRENGTGDEKSLTLVFVETKTGADTLENWLCMNEFPATSIHGDKTQQPRYRQVKHINLEFSQGIEGSHLLLVKSQCQNALLSLKCLNLNGCQKISDGGIEAITSICPNLKAISIYWNVRVTDDCIRHLVNNCRTIIDLNLSGCKSITDKGMQLVAESYQDLESLNITRCVKITYDGLLHVLHKCSTLQTLNLYALSGFIDKAYKKISLLADLRFLDLCGAQNLFDEGLTHMAKCIKLESLNLTWCVQITDSGVITIANSCTSLEFLSLFGIVGVTDRCLETLSQTCSATLTTLDVNGCIGIKRRSREELLQMFPRLTCFKVHS
ncbi:unnamed protein product [Brassica oleracea]|uniref:(rape) hypothetical protein n=1 Tax=Brassica napus TaxID=3708 RepID=A0A816JP76_BRANA|nr:unnamed protein product [Brassica napus]